SGLGIECDGAMYHSSRVARDRDRLRQQVLEGLGWKLHRTWGTDWYRDRAAAEQRLREAEKQAVAQEPPGTFKQEPTGIRVNPATEDREPSSTAEASAAPPAGSASGPERVPVYLRVERHGAFPTRLPSCTCPQG
ncbi:hypothetical protein, partial [Streptomyces lunaelactis]|uniref:hypothetical protein n=1 Tax=Streptomyces lunaelactis TaxID=1535768 RepID=UPI0020C813C7